MSTRSLVSAAYRLDLQDEAWIAHLADVLSEICGQRVEIGHLDSKSGEVKYFTGDDSFYEDVCLSRYSLMGTCGMCQCDESAQRVCWLVVGNEALVVKCDGGPVRRSEPAWEAICPILKSSLGIRGAICAQRQHDDEDLRESLKGLINATQSVTHFLQNPEPFLGQTVWEGVLEGSWSIVDVHEGEDGWNVVALANDGKSDPRALSQREKQVVKLAGQGMANKEIAFELGLTTSSVASFLKRAMEKLHIASRVQLVVFAGMLQMPTTPGTQGSLVPGDVAKMAHDLERALSQLEDVVNGKAPELREFRRLLSEIVEQR